jgi:glycosyltransferase involved in cell wall biosynthesis
MMSRKKNILIINDSFAHNRGGAESLSVATARKLAVRGHNVTALSALALKDMSFQYEGIDVNAFNAVGSDEYYNLLTLYNRRALQKLRKFLCGRYFDVCLINNVHSGFSYATIELLKKYARRSIHVSHDITNLAYGGYMGYANATYTTPDEINFKVTAHSLIKQYRTKVMPFRNTIIRKMLRNVDRIVAVSSLHERALNANSIHNTIVINPGVEASDFLLQEDRERREKEEFRILFAGKATLGKGLVPLLEMASVLKSRNKPFHLTITASLEGDIQRLLQGKYATLADKVSCVGWLDKQALSELYYDNDLLISPSVAFEAFGLVNLEAGLHGLPVISSIYGGPSDYVIEGHNGYLVNPLNTEWLVARVMKLMDDQTLCRSMGLNNQTRAREFSMDRMITRYEKLLFENT